jgi:hypothetical protein
MNKTEIFEKSGYVYVNNFLNDETVSLVSQYLENKIKRKEWSPGIEPGPEPVTNYFYYADPLIETLLIKQKKSIEELVGKELIPTYSYTRIYQPGEKLSPHTDRPACEISVTINIASKGRKSPIFLQYKHSFPQEFTLSPGDAIIYKGCEALHWRLPLEEDQLNVQFMLHYVDKNGPNADYAKDTRPDYGLPTETKRRK